MHDPDADAWPNPYDPPKSPVGAGGWPRPQSQARPAAWDPSGAIQTCVVLNAVLGGLSVVVALVMGFVLAYGVFFSGDTGEQLVLGVVGCLVFALPALVGAGVYLGAAFGLGRRARWGYVLHLVGTALAAFTCVGLVYTAIGLSLALQAPFRAAFEPEADWG